MAIVVAPVFSVVGRLQRRLQDMVRLPPSVENHRIEIRICTLLSQWPPPTPLHFGGVPEGRGALRNMNYIYALFSVP